VAPFVAGALLGYLTWRQVVVVNVIPGIAMAALLLVLLGGMQSKPHAAASGVKPAKR
jgi:MFS family permease